ncbi:MAG: hypothetical protein COC15_04350 [Legionellales bacterium]|nr:MAG: hypothetical protein COC15_04350 [Legionellales bacterium]
MKNYIITGCSRGLGLEMVAQLAKSGCRIYACARNINTDKLIILKQQYPNLITLIPFDIRDKLTTDLFFEYVEKKSFSIDILINNAGVLLDSEIPVSTKHCFNAKEMMAVNYFGTINVINFLLPYLEKSPQPLIINISSIMGSFGTMQHGGDWGYRASKTALNMFTKCFAIENPDIPIVALHPGHVQTDMGRINPPLTTEASVRFMMKTWVSLSKKDSGKFINYDGATLAW